MRFLEIWDALGAGKYGLLGVVLRIVVMPPANAKEAAQILVVGALTSLFFIALAETYAPSATTVAAWLGGIIGGTVILKLILWVKDASLADIIRAWRGSPPPDDNDTPGP